VRIAASGLTHMADTISNLTFDDDRLMLLGTQLASYSGCLDVDYDTMSVTGTLHTKILSNSTILNYTRYRMSFSDLTNQYTIVGTISESAGCICLKYEGQAPTSIAASASILGLPLLSGDAGAVVVRSISFTEEVKKQTASPFRGFLGGV
jgi:hypothetical protein